MDVALRERDLDVVLVEGLPDHEVQLTLKPPFVDLGAIVPDLQRQDDRAVGV